jgi:hypothetical protein
LNTENVKIGTTGFLGDLRKGELSTLGGASSVGASAFFLDFFLVKIIAVVAILPPSREFFLEKRVFFAASPPVFVRRGDVIITTAFWRKTFGFVETPRRLSAKFESGFV